ncbi:MAG: hypothetical protein HQL31_03090 [Planctomycetes bacterium]|nr:hypothetical protein [Planctomycetota bacterium]
MNVWCNKLSFPLILLCCLLTALACGGSGSEAGGSRVSLRLSVSSGDRVCVYGLGGSLDDPGAEWASADYSASSGMAIVQITPDRPYRIVLKRMGQNLFETIVLQDDFSSVKNGVLDLGDLNAATTYFTWMAFAGASGEKDVEDLFAFQLTQQGFASSTQLRLETLSTAQHLSVATLNRIHFTMLQLARLSKTLATGSAPKDQWNLLRSLTVAFWSSFTDKQAFMAAHSLPSLTDAAPTNANLAAIYKSLYNRGGEAALLEVSALEVGHLYVTPSTSAKPRGSVSPNSLQTLLDSVQGRYATSLELWLRDTYSDFYFAFRTPQAGDHLEYVHGSTGQSTSNEIRRSYSEITIPPHYGGDLFGPYILCSEELVSPVQLRSSTYGTTKGKEVSFVSPAYFTTLENTTTVGFKNPDVSSLNQSWKVIETQDRFNPGDDALEALTSFTRFYEVVGQESLTVEAGTFSAMHIRETLSGNIDEVSGSAWVVTGNVDRWYEIGSGVLSKELRHETYTEIPSSLKPRQTSIPGSYTVQETLELKTLSLASPDITTPSAGEESQGTEQAPVFLKTFGDMGSETLVDLTFNQSGEFFAFGYFTGRARFTTDGTGAGNLPISGEGTYDLFVAKYNSAGELLWWKQLGMGTVTPPKVSGIALSTDESYLMLTGIVDDEIDLVNTGAPGVRAANLTTSVSGSGAGFILRMRSTDGETDLYYSQVFGGSSRGMNIENLSGIAVDPQSGDYYIGGTYSGAGTTLSSGNSIVGQGNQDAFILRLNMDMLKNFALDPEWIAGVMSGAGNDSLNELTVSPEGDIYIVGTQELAGQRVGYTARCDASGSILWSRTCSLDSGDMSDDAFSLALDATGAPYTVGRISGAATLSIDGDSTLPLTVVHDSVFLAPYTSEGVLQTSVTAVFGALEMDTQAKSQAVAFNPAGQFYVGGSILGDGVIDYDPNPSSSAYMVAPWAGQSAFLSEFDAAMNYIGTSHFRGAGSPENSVKIDRLLVNRNGRFYALGTFSGTINFNPISGENMSVTAQVNTDIFILGYP